MVARTQGWIKGRDKPNERTFELPHVNVRQNTPAEELQEQLKHANEQLALTRAYPGRERK